MKLATLFVCASLGMMPAALAQKWEFGGGVGGGFYASKDVTSPGGTATTKIQSNLAGSVWLGNNVGSHLGGEVRYDYQAGDLQLKQGSTEELFGAQTHAIHYDFLFHFTDTEAAIRPFVAAGGGIKIYRGTGSEVPFRPLDNFALFTKAQDLVGMVSVGAGVKFRLTPHLQLRLDVHDYLTPFPNQVITPNVGSKISGWLQDIVPMAGISATF